MSIRRGTKKDSVTGTMNVAGLDIGFSARRPSAGVALFDGQCVRTAHCYGVDACSSIIRSGKFRIIAIDGPVVSKGYESIRAIERLFSTGLFQKRCKPGMSHVRTTGVRFREEAGKAADLLPEALIDRQATALFPRIREKEIIEAFPNAFLGVCLDDKVFAAMPSLRRGKKFDWLYDQWRNKQVIEGLPGLNPTERQIFKNKLELTTHHEHRAALICLLTALITARGEFTAIGDTEGGWFFLPSWSYWEKWAQDTAVVGVEALNRQGARLEIWRNSLHRVD